MWWRGWWWCECGWRNLLGGIKQNTRNNDKTDNTHDSNDTTIINYNYGDDYDDGNDEGSGRGKVEG